MHFSFPRSFVRSVLEMKGFLVSARKAASLVRAGKYQALLPMLFDWLVTGQVVPMNPAAAVRGPKHIVKTGKTPVLDGAEWRKLIDSIPTSTLRDLPDS